MATIIDPSDRRTAKALEILTTSGQWLRCRNKDGQGKRYGVPSQADPHRYYFVNARTCSCKSFEYDGSCKHVLAVQLFIATVRFQMERSSTRP